MDGSYLDRWASWVARLLVAGRVVTVGAYSWSPTAGAETSMWDSVPLPGPRRGRLEVRCVTLTVPVDDADRGRGSLGVAMIRVRSADQHDYAYVLPDWARTPIHTALERSLCVAQRVIPYFVEVRVAGGHAW